MKQTFGTQLRAVRKQHGYTQKELATLIEVSERTVKNYEADRHAPPKMMQTAIVNKIKSC